MRRNLQGETRLARLGQTRIGDLGMYLRRLLGRAFFEPGKYSLGDDCDPEDIQRMVYLIRGEDYRPAIFIHGVLPRSGTNFLADLMGRHRDVYPYTRQFWEFPLLSFTGNVVRLQREFDRKIAKYPASLKPYAFSAYLNAGLMKDLQAQAGGDKAMLFKYPFVHYLDLFRAFFPRDYQLLVLRDGRDVVASSLRTFGTGRFKKRFSDYCREWDCAARCILQYDQGALARDPRTMVVRFERLHHDPVASIRRILSALELDSSRFDFQDLQHQPVRGSSNVRDDRGNISWKPQQRPRAFNPIGRWADWTREQKRRFKDIAGESLIAAGYARGNDW